MRPIYIFAITIVFLAIYWTCDYIKYVKVKSIIDDRIYKVKRTSVSQQSADSLALINQKIIKLIEYIKNLPDNSKPRYTKRLEMYNPSNISENVWNIDTTYTLNKGENVYFCMGPRDDETKIYDINTLMYVAIHELAHIASVSVGHTEEFKIIFKELIIFSTNCGSYTYVDYSKKPINYCGIDLTTNIAT